MGILGMIENDEYLPEFGTLVLRDAAGAERLPELDGLSGELATSALPGELATAGDGWLHGTTGDPYQAVRVEAHDVEPEMGLGEWEDVLVTPYRSRTGSVRLGLLTGGESGDALDLGGSGLFAVRVARRAAEEGVSGKVWLLQFWPGEASTGHRWVKRTTAAEGGGESGWQHVLGYPAMEVAYFAAGYGMRHPESWYDEPLPGDPVPASVCAQLGVPVPVTRRDALPLLVAAGVLAPEDTAPAPGDAVLGREGAGLAPGDGALAGENAVLVPGDAAPVPGDAVLAPGDGVVGREGAVLALGDGALAGEGAALGLGTLCWGGKRLRWCRGMLCWGAKALCGRPGALRL